MASWYFFLLEQEALADMKLVPSNFVIGGYPLVMMRGPLMVWLPCGIFGPLFAIEFIGFQVWKKGRISTSAPYLFD
jgi:hypothetical protein